MTGLIDIISFALMTLGGFLVIIGGVGILRMPDLFTRMHAASITDTGGMVLVLAGLMLQAGWTLVLVKLAAIIIFMLITSPTASYALANAALLSGEKPFGEDETGDETPPETVRSLSRAAAAAQQSSSPETGQEIGQETGEKNGGRT